MINLKREKNNLKKKYNKKYKKLYVGNENNGDRGFWKCDWSNSLVAFAAETSAGMILIIATWRITQQREKV